MSDNAERKPRQMIYLNGGNVTIEGIEYCYADGDDQIYEAGALSEREISLAVELVIAMKPARGVSEIRIHLKDRRAV